MAKFCANCGKELKDGKCSKCDKETKKVKKEEVKDTAPSVDVEDIKAAGSDCLKATTGVFSKPFDVIKSFVTDNKLMAGIIMLLLVAISSGLYRIATIKAAVGATSDNGFNANELMNILYGGNFSISKEPNYLNEFFTKAGTQLAILAFIALFGYLIITKLLKGKATWKQMVTAVAISFSVVLVGNLINSILVFIDAEVMGYIRNYISSFANILSILILYYGVKEVAEVDKNKLFLAVASMSVAATAAWDIIDKIFD